jgi:hypothetical protein
VFPLQASFCFPILGITFFIDRIRVMPIFCFSQPRARALEFHSGPFGRWQSGNVCENYSDCRCGLDIPAAVVPSLTDLSAQLAAIDEEKNFPFHTVAETKHIPAMQVLMLGISRRKRIEPVISLRRTCTSTH